MPPDPEAKVLEVLEAALTLPPEERQTYIDGELPESPTCRARVEALLAAHEPALGFLDSSLTLDFSRLESWPGPSDEPELHLGERYEVGEEIARGGIGRVLEVHDRELERTIAAKTLLSDVSPAPSETPRASPLDVKPKTIHLARFLEEAQVTAQLEHPGVVPVHEVGYDFGGRAYFTMRRVHGKELTEVIDLARSESEGWNQTRAVGVLVKVCQAVAYAHSRGVVHRDLKPGNVMVGAFGETYVMDWGLAKVAGRPDAHESDPMQSVQSARRLVNAQDPDSPLRTVAGTILGTPSFMAPEQASGQLERVGPSSDVYSLGAMLYVLLAGRLPYVPENSKLTPHTILGLVANGPPNPVGTLAPDAPLELIAICEKAMAREPADRYSSALEIAEDLQAHLDGRVVKAHRTGTLAELSKWIQRNRGTAASILAVLLLTLGSLSVLWIQERRTREKLEDASFEISRERDSANAARTLAVDRLVDVYASNGLATHDSGRPAEAALWFATAADLAENSDDPAAVDINRMRARTWLRDQPLPVAALEHPGENFFSLEFHPRSPHLLSRGHRQAAVWDLEREVRVDGFVEEKVQEAAWSVDGERLALGHQNGVVVVEFPTCEHVATLPWEGRVRQVAFHPDGSLLAVGGSTLEVFKLASGETWPVNAEGQEPVTTLEFSDDGRYLAVGHEKSELRLYRTRGEHWEPAMPPVRHLSFFNDMGGERVTPRFLRGGTELFTCTSYDRPTEFTRWRIEDGKPLQRIAKSLSSLTVLPQSHLLVFSSRSALDLLDASSGEFEDVPVSHEDTITSLTFSPAGGLLLTTSVDRTAQLWSWPSGEALGPAITHSTSVQAATISSDTRHFATAQQGGLIRVWTLPWRSGECTLETKRDIALTKFSPRGDWVMTLGCTNRNTRRQHVRVYDAKTGDVAGPPIYPGALVLDADFSPDGSRIALIGPTTERRAYREASRLLRDEAGGYLWRYDWQQGLPSHEAIELPYEPRSVCYSPDAEWIAVTCALGDLYVLGAEDSEAVTVQERHTVRRDNRYTVNGKVGFSPRSDAVVAWGFDTRLRAWNLEDGKERFPPLEHDAFCHGVTFTDDGRYLATAAFDRRVRVWDFASGQPACEPLEHPDWVFLVEFDHTGDRLLSACRDGAARLWNWRDGSLPIPPMRHGDEVKDIAFLAASTRAVTCGHDDTLRIWDLGKGALLAPLLPADDPWDIDVSQVGPKVSFGGPGPRVALIDLSFLSEDAPGDGREVLIAELVSSSRLVAGVATMLSGAEWLERWRALGEERPQRLTFRAQADDPSRYRERAHALLAAGNREAALWHIERTLSHGEPRQSDRLFHSRVLFELERWSRAEEVCTQILQIDDRETDAWHRRGHCRERLNRPEDAAADFERAAELAPGPRHLRQHLALNQSRSGHRQAAAEISTRCTEIDSADVASWEESALLLLECGRETSYRMWARSLLESHREARSTRVRTALLWVVGLAPDALADHDSTLEMARELVQKRSERDTLSAFATLAYRAGRYEEARSTLHGLVGEDRRGGTVHDQIVLAMAEKQLGNRNLARECLDRVRVILDDDPERDRTAWFLQAKTRRFFEEAEATLGED